MVKNVIEYFFSWGDKITKGDVKLKAKWDLWLLVVMFIAFFSILVSNFSLFLDYFGSDFIVSLKYLGWSGVMVAILWFQYFGLKSAWEFNKLLNGNSSDKIDTKDEMLDSFKDEEVKEFVDKEKKQVKKRYLDEETKEIFDNNTCKEEKSETKNE